MAVPIRLESTRQEACAELQRRLEQAPAEHAEALLAAYDLLQGLHDRRILDAIRGALSSGDFILETLVKTANTPEAIRTIRNLILLSKVLGNIEPEQLDRLAGIVPDGLAEIPTMKTEPPGLFSLLRKFNNPDCRRAMAFTAALLETLGKRLAR